MQYSFGAEMINMHVQKVAYVIHVYSDNKVCCTTMHMDTHTRTHAPYTLITYIRTVSYEYPASPLPPCPTLLNQQATACSQGGPQMRVYVTPQVHLCVHTHENILYANM